MEEEGLDLRLLWGILLRWWWVLVLGVVVAGGAAYFLSKATTPIYKASALLLVQGGQTPGIPSASEIQASQGLARNYSDLIKTRSVLEEVIEDLSLPYDSGSLSNKISVSTPRSLIEIKISDPNPQDASDIANAVAQTFIDDFRDRQLTLIAQFQASLSQYGITDDPSLIAAQAATMSTLSILEQAIPPTSPSGPNTRLNVLLGVFLGLAVAGLVVFVIEYLDDTIKTAEELGNISGLMSLGSVMRYSVRGGALPTLLDERLKRGGLAESYKYLALNLEFAGLATDEIKTVLITSALPGEGKTTTAANLAISLAREGKSVVLVDTDLRKPAIHRVFDMDNSIGLTNVLLGNIPLDDVFSSTPIESLKVIPSGPIPPDASIVLRAAQMRETISALADKADVVIFDSPPVLAVTDPIVMAPQVDAIVLVLNARQTRRKLVKRMVESLQQTSTPILGAVFNMVVSRRTDYYYSPSSYYSYYGDGYSENSSDGHRLRGGPMGVLARARRRIKGRQKVDVE